MTNDSKGSSIKWEDILILKLNANIILEEIPRRIYIDFLVEKILRSMLVLKAPYRMSTLELIEIKL